MIDQLEKVDRSILSLAHMMWFRKLVLIFVACVAALLAAGAVAGACKEIVGEAECVVLPIVRGAAAALPNVPANFSNLQNPRETMSYHRLISTMVFLGIVLHAVLVDIHIREKLARRLKRHPVWLTATAAAGAILIAAGAIPELGNVVGGVIT